MIVRKCEMYFVRFDISMCLGLSVWPMIFTESCSAFGFSGVNGRFENR